MTIINPVFSCVALNKQHAGTVINRVLFNPRRSWQNLVVYRTILENSREVGAGRNLGEAAGTSRPIIVHDRGPRSDVRESSMF
jgi:hypothetical protein